MPLQLLIVTPEYNYGVPGVLKNAIDWASRPPSSSVLDGKPIALMGATPGRTGTARAQLALRQSFVFTRSPLLPGPEVLVQMRSFKGLFGRKVEYLNALGHSALAGELDTETLRALPPDASLERLKRLAGIGEFGSQLIRLRALSAVDELPTTERRLLEAIRTAYGLTHEPDIAELEAIAERWRPYRMWVAVCFRRSLADGAGMMHSRAAG